MTRLLVAVLLLLSLTSLAEALSYAVHDLGMAYSECRSINSRGQVAGHYYNPEGWTHAFLYDPTDGLLDLGTLGGDDSYAYGLNDLGDVVGWSYGAVGHSAFLWDEEQGMQDIGLDLFDGTVIWSSATDINRSGTICGVAYPNGGGVFRWNRATGAYTSLASPFYPMDINDSDQVAGSVAVDGWSAAAVLETDASVRVLHRMCERNSEAQAINNAGWVAGAMDCPQAENPDVFRQCACVWMPGEPVQVLCEGWACDVSDTGRVLINRSNQAGADVVSVWSEESGLVDVGLGRAYGINSTGTICGYVGTRAVIWEPVPEPTTSAAVLFGLSFLGCHLRRRRRG